MDHCPHHRPHPTLPSSLVPISALRRLFPSMLLQLLLHLSPDTTPHSLENEEECYLGRLESRHSHLFSVSIHHATIQSCFSNDVSLLSIRFCQPEAQQAHKLHRCSHKPLRRPRLFTTLFGLITSSLLNTQHDYSLPGTQHILAHEKSLDINRQQSLIETVITNAVNNPSLTPSSIITNDTTHNPDTANLHNTPFCFLCDIDSIPHLADTGANRVILNNPKLINNFKVANGGVKGINGTPVAIAGVGEYDFPLRSDLGVKHKIKVPAVCVPSSPFCLFPPQLLHKLLQDKGFRVKHFKHDDKEYIFEYCPPNEHNWHKMTIPVDQKGMFTHWSNPGYKHFFSLASEYDSSWNKFAGHKGADEDTSLDDSASTTTTRETPVKMREPSLAGSPSFTTNTNKPEGGNASHSINSQYYAPPRPINVDLNSPSSPDLPPKDPAVQALKIKQHRLSILHERYGHLSFPKMRLMARGQCPPPERKGRAPHQRHYSRCSHSSPRRGSPLSDCY